jgi:hypothetical protein
MKEFVNTVLASGVVAGIVSSLVGGAVGWLAASSKIKQEFHFRQAESGYEALVKANALLRQAEQDEQSSDEERAREARKLRDESNREYQIARQKIAAFGHESVVKALSDYYATYSEAKPCSNKEKFRSDAKTYKAIRNTLGVGGDVSDEQVAILMFHCSLR